LAPFLVDAVATTLLAGLFAARHRRRALRRVLPMPVSCPSCPVN
jgi:hypothetical protein